ncbi:MAG: sensor histidine kinase [Dehalococcoidia bacterium]
MSISIRWRLAFGIILAFVATLAVLFVTVQFALTRILTDNLDDRLADDALLVQAEATLAGERWLESGPDSFGEGIIDHARRAEGRSPFITVIRAPSGEQLLSSGRIQESYLALSQEEIARVLAGGAITSTVNLPGDEAGGDEYRVRSQRLSIGDQIVGIVQVAQVTEGITDPVSTLLVILIAEGVAATLLTVVIAVWLSRGAVKPLQRVIDVAADIEARDLRTRINARKQPAEVQKLADTFDAMLGRLEKAFQEQEDFVLDVSHELRTPLTVLKGNVDVMLMDDGLDADTRERFDRMASEISRMIRLTSNLLYMASADAGRVPEARPVELDVVCLEVLRQSRELRPGVKLSLGREDQITVEGDRDQLKQMALNLVENAMKYTPEGGEVSLSFYKNAENAEVRVSDTGPGIEPEMLSHIFERFYRGATRSLMGGTGLGLSIAHRIAMSHGGRIDVESEVGVGTTFTVVLPLLRDTDGNPAEVVASEESPDQA